MNRFKKNANDMGVSKSVNTAKKFAVNKSDMLGSQNSPKKTVEKSSPKLTPNSFKRKM